MKGNSARSTVAQKLFIGISGLFLCGFVVAHLAGNLLLYFTDKNYKAFNAYAEALHASALLPVAEIGLLVLFGAHIVMSLWMQVTNRQARPEGYAVQRSKRRSGAFSAQNVMMLSGLIVLAFIFLHLADLRFGLRFEEAGLSPSERVLQVLRDPVSAMFYTVGPLLLGYHLFHGFQSSFQSLGLGGDRFTRWTKVVGVIFAVVAAIGFASLPVWVTLFRK